MLQVYRVKQFVFQKARGTVQRLVMKAHRARTDLVPPLVPVLGSRVVGFQLVLALAARAGCRERRFSSFRGKQRHRTPARS